MVQTNRQQMNPLVLNKAFNRTANQTPQPMSGNVPFTGPNGAQKPMSHMAQQAQQQQQQQQAQQQQQQQQAQQQPASTTTCPTASPADSAIARPFTAWHTESVHAVESRSVAAAHLFKNVLETKNKARQGLPPGGPPSVGTQPGPARPVPAVPFNQSPPLPTGVTALQDPAPAASQPAPVAQPIVLQPTLCKSSKCRPYAAQNRPAAVNASPLQNQKSMKRPDSDDAVDTPNQANNALQQPSQPFPPPHSEARATIQGMRLTPEQIAKMTPEQRAKYEALLQARQQLQ
ncbi:hypothetical protein B0T26DRAFT_672568 [Lasiosphaeria miniovina]|uniref:Uncharacterized protein n=1 Tax=Lasiosphaeria miniovina TaxID=1954250 RepID=A0AA40E4M5_9PEZI|nr:uncharacterized protein B0T26DRAFT_672568 [Lasiosphaeria miniovina]KAK0727969.1 hypothetical protein B0T26DRAFT_672568 [Lasiosphaeria miniovina]